MPLLRELRLQGGAGVRLGPQGWAGDGGAVQGGVHTGVPARPHPGLHLPQGPAAGDDRLPRRREPPLRRRAAQQ
ncbi:MAG: hypothetical protein ACK559_21680, partial [bacterium]